jgi:uncharacterized membrane protein YecN with MAPEG domain
METEGDFGRFNRAQRALQNYLEQLPIVLALFVAAGFVFPFPSFVVIIVFCLMRIMSAIGYTAQSSGRMNGNMLAALGVEVLQGFILIAGVKALVQ